MGGLLDITPLRSLVAVADSGGFSRAAETLHMSQAGVSQHVRRLEQTVGRRLVERDGRSSRFTPDGEALLEHARRILSAHDDALAHFAPDRPRVLVVGSTEHAAAQLLPALTSAMAADGTDWEVRLRLDRGSRLRVDLAAGRVDLAVLPGPTAHPELGSGLRATTLGPLELTWFGAPGWEAPASGPVPLVAFEAPCALRTRAMQTLASHGRTAATGSEAVQLAGVQAAAAAGMGVALMATMGRVPDGLVRAEGLPEAAPLEFSLWGRAGVDVERFEFVAQALRTAVEEAAGIAAGDVIDQPA